MKKCLLMAGALMLLPAVSALGEGFIRQVAPDLAVSNISPNGRYVVSQVYGYLEIFDLETGGKYEYYGDQDLGEAYDFGQGNSISDIGIGVGSTTSNGNACVWEKGVWTELPVPHPELTNTAHGITPDASRICGQVGNARMSTETTEIMSVPCVWNRAEDGTFSAPVLLPHPDLDFTGRVPQYITALEISADGRTVAGQIRDFSGMMIQPILYREDEKGEWSYEVLFPELTNPDGIVLPPDPGEAPQNAPNMRDFMTPEEQDTYDAALAQWEADGGDWADYPDMEDYMTPEELAAFNKAADEYNKAVEEWAKEYEPFQTALNKIMEKGTAFLFNNVYLSPDGKSYASTAIEAIEDPTSWTGFSEAYRPYLLDLENMTYRALPGEQSLRVTGLTADYTVLATTDGLAAPQQAFLSLEGKGDWVALETWLDSVDPEVGKWFTEQTTHDVDIVVDEMPEVAKDYVCSGTAVCTPDMTLFATYSEVQWESTTSTYTEACIFTVNSNSGVECIAAPEGEVVSVVYHSLDGRRLEKAPAEGLALRRTEFTDGTSRTEKILF